MSLKRFAKKIKKAVSKTVKEIARVQYDITVGLVIKQTANLLQKANEKGIRGWFGNKLYDTSITLKNLNDRGRNDYINASSSLVQGHFKDAFINITDGSAILSSVYLIGLGGGSAFLGFLQLDLAGGGYIAARENISNISHLLNKDKDDISLFYSIGINLYRPNLLPNGAELISAYLDYEESKKEKQQAQKRYEEYKAELEKRKAQKNALDEMFINSLISLEFYEFLAGGQIYNSYFAGNERYYEFIENPWYVISNQFIAQEPIFKELSSFISLSKYEDNNFIEEIINF